MQATVDACSLINLIASGYSDDIIVTADLELVVPPHVFRETFDTTRVSPENLGIRPNFPDLASAAVGNRLRRTALNPSELQTFVSIASTTRLGDGEAACIAVAIHRGLGFVSDDRLARRYVRDLLPSATLADTPELLWRWAATTTSEHVKKAINRIETRANFRISARHERGAWWKSVAASH